MAMLSLSLPHIYIYIFIHTRRLPKPDQSIVGCCRTSCPGLNPPTKTDGRVMNAQRKVTWKPSYMTAPSATNFPGQTQQVIHLLKVLVITTIIMTLRIVVIPPHLRQVPCNTRLD